MPSLNNKQNAGKGASAAAKELQKLRRVDLLELLLDAMRENEKNVADIEELTDLSERLKAKLDEKDEQLERLKAKLDEKDAILDKKDAILDKKDSLLDGKDARINELSDEIAQRDAQIAELQEQALKIAGGHFDIEEFFSRLRTAAEAYLSPGEPSRASVRRAAAEELVAMEVSDEAGDGNVDAATADAEPEIVNPEDEEAGSDDISEDTIDELGGDAAEDAEGGVSDGDDAEPSSQDGQ